MLRATSTTLYATAVSPAARLALVVPTSSAAAARSVRAASIQQQQQSGVRLLSSVPWSSCRSVTSDGDGATRATLPVSLISKLPSAHWYGSPTTETAGKVGPRAAATRVGGVECSGTGGGGGRQAATASRYYTSHASGRRSNTCVDSDDDSSTLQFSGGEPATAAVLLPGQTTSGEGTAAVTAEGEGTTATSEAATAATTGSARLTVADALKLSKHRLSALVTLTAAGGFAMAPEALCDAPHAFTLLAVAGGTGTIAELMCVCPHTLQTPTRINTHVRAHT